MCAPGGCSAEEAGFGGRSALRNPWRQTLAGGDRGRLPPGRQTPAARRDVENEGGARRKLYAIKDQIKQHGTTLDTKTVVEQWATHWLETVGKPNLKPNTLLSYESVTRNWIIPTIGAKKVAFLKPSDVRITGELAGGPAAWTKPLDPPSDRGVRPSC
ncbi:N-terminal phage integrase SAM-like domain-containing protein [Curtobacterium sp. MCPF17_046]|uniref:N-terminal phage integrase SAM-like domain-containing protein n=1 Tax=Curtobacterium sp. MCPF17_046 TaxID=2175663 RepID=UPI000D8DFAB0|nr:N-terminal phage integrase SAM-like domain-containing protein [Curtobacterium sp. MCPF17_046]PYY40777.1 hypothetical protein DEJ32_05265 [Curtobacterium sp. MCPF17_046]